MKLSCFSTFLLFLTLTVSAFAKDYIGVIEKSEPHNRLVFHYHFDSTIKFYLTESKQFNPGDSVVVSGRFRTDDSFTEVYYEPGVRKYNDTYPILFVDEIKKYTLADRDTTRYREFVGELFTDAFNNLMFLNNSNNISLYLTKSDDFHNGDTVVVKGLFKNKHTDAFTLYGYPFDEEVEMYKDRYPVFYVHSIARLECCTNEMRGDINLDNRIDLADLIGLLNFINRYGYYNFKYIYCREKYDLNLDGELNMSDYDLLFEYFMNCGPPPAKCEL